MSGLLVARGGGVYKITDAIPRFVEDRTYADSFALQWNAFRKTQLDSWSGRPISADRFYRFTRWNPAALTGKRVLEVGCGAGRFTEIALAAGARVVAVDYTRAADACWLNHQSRPNLDVVQADLYELPFEDESFDFVYCFGVLQHTPDVRRAFFSLVPQTKAGGALAVDLYPKLWRNLFWSKYWIRPFTRHLAPSRLFKIVRHLTPPLLSLSRFLSRLPLIGKAARYALPVANYDGVYPLSDEQIEEWAVLDTFDMLSPTFDKPQREGTLRRWFHEAGFTSVSVERVGFLVGRGIK